MHKKTYTKLFFTILLLANALSSNSMNVGAFNPMAPAIKGACNTIATSTIYFGQFLLKEYRFYKIKNNKLKTAKLLVYYDSINQKRFYHEGTPLYYACKANDLEMTQVLLENGANANISNGKKQSPLWWACYNNNLDMVELLLPYCNEITVCQRGAIADMGAIGRTPLFLACEHQNIKMIKILLKHGAQKSIDTPNFWSDTTPLNLLRDNPEGERLLVENGAENFTVTADPRNLLGGLSQYVEAVLKYEKMFNSIQLDFIQKALIDNNNQIHNILRLEFCESLRKFIQSTADITSTLFYKIYQLAKTNTNLKKALCKTFELENDELLKNKNYIKLIDHAIKNIVFLTEAQSDKTKRKLKTYRSMYEDQQTRDEFLKNDTKEFGAKQFSINLNNKEIVGNKLFFL